jgi:glutathione S-transferase
MKLYDYPASCNCYKVRLLLSNLARDYERVPVDIFGGDTLTDGYARINPARSTPVLETDDGRFLPESNAILVHLAHGTPLLPADPFELGQVVRWLMYEQADLVPTIGGLRFRLLVGRLQEGDPEVARRREGGREVLRLLDDHLDERAFFLGERYTVADIAIYGYSHRADEAGIDLQPYPNVLRWFERVEAQPGYMEDVEPYGPGAAPGAGRSIYG